MLGNSEPLTDEEREQLRQRLLQRRQELQQQQQQVKELQGRVSQAVREGLLAPGASSSATAGGEDADVSKVGKHPLQAETILLSRFSLSVPAFAAFFPPCLICTRPGGGLSARSDLGRHPAGWQVSAASVASLVNEVIASVNSLQAAAAAAPEAAGGGASAADRQGGGAHKPAAAAEPAAAAAATPFSRHSAFSDGLPPARRQAAAGWAGMAQPAGRGPTSGLRQRVVGFRVAKLEAADSAILPKAAVSTIERGVQASLDPPAEAKRETAEVHEAEGSLAVPNGLKRSLTAKVASPLLPAAELGGLHATVETHPAPPEPTKIHQLEDAESRRVMATPKFAEFFSSSTKLVERLLGESEVFSAFVDYSGAEAETREGSEELLTFVDVYKDSRYAPHRPITDLRSSPAFPELFLAAYGSPASKFATAADADGCVLVWSLALKQRPEYVFTCQSAVCSALFDKFQPYVVVGGTYGGSIVLWDSRAQSKPVQRTPLSAKGHASPVFSLEMVGTKNAHNLVSVDTDGRLCQWSLQMMGQPAETLDLKRGSRDVCVECVAFPEGEVNVLCLGAEDGSLMTANIHGNKVGIMDAYEAHGGALTSLHFHPGPGEGWGDHSHLLLSSSVDWSIKLWSNKNLESPIASFEADAYVYDAKWHPTNAALFASTDGAGSLQLWNLASDWVGPVFSSPHAELPAGSLLARNKAAWSADGRRLATGDAVGSIEVWNLSSQLHQPRVEEAAKFERQIEGAKPWVCCLLLLGAVGCFCCCCQEGGPPRGAAEEEEQQHAAPTEEAAATAAAGWPLLCGLRVLAKAGSEEGPQGDISAE
ncbi:hypothetical protein Efla_004989 [Eimeria flavescens]